MAFNSPGAFFLLCGALVVLSLPWQRTRIKVVFLALSLAFAALSYRTSPKSAIVLAFVVLTHFAVLRLMLACRGDFAKICLHHAWLILALAGFALVKRYDWVTSLLVSPDQIPGGLGWITVGYSFILFRQIHLGVEIRDRMIDRLDLVDYLNYVGAFWTFMAGPIQRYDDFRARFEEMAGCSGRTPASETLAGLNRVMFGFLKMFVVGTWIQSYAKTQTFLASPDAPHLALFLIAFPLYLYVNFSGYCDIVIGFGRSVGFRLPENFVRPFLARNVVDFWGRWHITLSQFFRDYLYFPLHASLSRHISPHVSMAMVSLFCFGAMGAWHGSSPAFAVFGLIHGVGVVVVNLYGEALKRWLGKERFQAYRENPWVKAAALALCQAYVVLSFLPFGYDSAELSAVWRQILSMALSGAIP